MLNPGLSIDMKKDIFSSIEKNINNKVIEWSKLYNIKPSLIEDLIAINMQYNILFEMNLQTIEDFKNLIVKNYTSFQVRPSALSNTFFALIQPATAPLLAPYRDRLFAAYAGYKIDALLAEIDKIIQENKYKRR